MEETSLIPPVRKYIIDASSLISQKSDESYNIAVHSSMWSKIADLINKGIIVTNRVILNEIRDPEVIDWLKSKGIQKLEIDKETQECVKKILKEHPKMIKIKKTGSSSGDPFLIASAMRYNLIVITEESKTSENKIPQVCDAYSIKCLNLNELCINEGWKF